MTEFFKTLILKYRMKTTRIASFEDLQDSTVLKKNIKTWLKYFDETVDRGQCKCPRRASALFKLWKFDVDAV